MSLSRQDKIEMKGDGFYSAVSAGPRAVVNSLYEPLITAIKATGHRGAKEPFCIADYGAADGVIALELLEKLDAYIRSGNADQELCCFSTDLPDADFRPLFRAVANRSKDGQHSGRPPYSFATGTSFFEQIFPSQSIHIGFSSSAMHYLRVLPTPISGHLHSAYASQNEIELFNAQARKDWECILVNRSKELAPGGRFVVAMLGVDDDGNFLGNTVGSSLFDNYSKLWRSLHADKIITAQECDQACFQQHFRTSTDLIEPFEGPGKLFGDSGLRLLSLRSQITVCPFQTAYLNGLDTFRFAHSFVNTHRSWTEIVFANALANSRPLEERRAIINELYTRYERLVEANPKEHRKDLVHWIVEIEKQRLS